MSSTIKAAAAAVADPPQQDIFYGIAGTAPRLPRHYKGRGGIWACEACNATKLLLKGTKSWNCPKCQTQNWTVPDNECPLERARRFIVNQRQKFEDAHLNNNTTDNVEENKKQVANSSPVSSEKQCVQHN